ncbi:MAG: tyrosine-type recombinase/integrase [Leptolyngbyaceae cyanobacterium]
MPRKKQKRQRHKKGSVVVSTRNGMLCLRWTYNSKPYYLAIGLPDTPLNRYRAQALADDIKSDISNQRFDPTLDKYRPQSGTPEPETVSTTMIFERFIEHRRNEGTSGQAISSKYVPLLSNLKRFGKDIKTEADARKFVELLRSRQAPLTSNQNLSLLKAFASWAVSQALIETDFFNSIKRLKASRAINPKRIPLTKEQIRAFLDAIKLDRYYYSYHDFCMTLFYLGLRPSEAAGLRWKHINWQRRTITICESMSRGPNGETAGYARQRKDTKNHRIREVEIRPKLYTALQGRYSSEFDPDALVFTTPRGKPIDDHNFSQRVWKRICKKIGIEKVPYAARHSLGSHLLEDGATIPQVANVLGNHPETAARHYAHMVNRPQMPDF